MSLELIQQEAVKTYNENVAYFKDHHPKLYQNLVFFETALNEKHIQPKFDLQWKENYFEIIGLEQNVPFYGQNSLNLSKKMVDNSPLFDATKNSFKTYYEMNYNDEVAKIGLNSDMLVKYTLSNAPIVHYVTKSLPKKQLLTDIHKFIVFGVGLGLHINYIHQQIQAKMYCIVEPNLEIFRLSLFVTNYAQLGKQAKLFLSVAQNEVEFRETFNKFYAESFILNHYLKFFQFGQGHDLYIKTIQNFLVSQPHYLYSYDRTFLSLSRTHNYISQDYRTLNVKDHHKLSILEKPVLYLAAGPSLQRNIQFVKDNQDKFIIIAIYATMPTLEKHNIKPDIITQYDEQDTQVLNTLEKITDIEFFKDSIFIFSSHVNAKLMTSFPKNNIYIFQAMFALKKDYGMLTSPSIGELTYALLLKFGAKNIYILGLDLAMDTKTNQTHIDGHTGSKVFSQLKDIEDSSDTEYSYRKNTILVKGNFIPEVKSIPVFKTNIDSFGVFTKQFKPQDCKVYNLSNGAFLEGAEPQRIEDLEIEALQRLDDKLLQKELHDGLNTISEQNYNKNDIESINLKISGVKKIKKLLEQFFKTKNHKSIEEYKNKLIIMLSDILFNKYHCDDLQQILINYSSHIMHHIFYLFSIKTNSDEKKHIYEINKILNIQINKILNTYVISIAYSKEESYLTKKLNKYIKEYSIKNTTYSEPMFKEMVETSLKGNQEEFHKGSLGFFAIEENLSNKAFIQYIQKLLETSPNISLKLFYFYDYQKTLAKHTLKKYLDRIKLIVPLDIEEIAKEVEVWFETSETTFSLKIVNDIILNKYENIYSILFKKELEGTNSLALDNTPSSNNSSLKDIVLHQYPLVTNNYYAFANTVDYHMEQKELADLYKEKHIGFFATEENLTKEFIQNILNIYNQFSDIQFVVFYFEEKQKTTFENSFRNLLSRFEFIIPNDIYDIANHIQIWVEAKMKFKSFLYNKIYAHFEQTNNIYPIVINEEYALLKDEKGHLPSIVSNFYEEHYKKSLLQDLKEIDQLDFYGKDHIGFFALEENLTEKFTKNIHHIYELFPSVKFIVFYFNEKNMELFKNNFSALLSRFEFVIPNDAYDINRKIEIFVESNYNNENPIFVKTRNYLDKSFNTYSSNLEQPLDDKQSDNYIQYTVPDFDEQMFIKSLKLPIHNSEIQNSSLSNDIGVFATEEYLNNDQFLNYIKQLDKVINISSFKILSFIKIDKTVIHQKLQSLRNPYEIVNIQSQSDIINNVDFLILDFKTATGPYYNNLSPLFENIYKSTSKINIILFNDSNYVKDITLKEVDPIEVGSRPHNVLIELGINDSDIKNKSSNFWKILLEYSFEKFNLDKTLYKDDMNYFEFSFIYLLKIMTENTDFKNFIKNIQRKLYDK